jgi:hypothetical protein
VHDKGRDPSTDQLASLQSKIQRIKIGKKKQQKKKKLIAWTTFGSLNRSICPLGTLPFVKDEKSMWTHMAMFSTSYTRDKGPVPAV